jgi:hypothetical protein
MDDVSKGRSGSGYNDKVARAAMETIFNPLQFLARELLAEPDDPGPHERSAFRASRKQILLLLLAVASAKIALRATRHEDVSMNLHHLLLCNSRTRVQVVHILRDEEELVSLLRQFRDRFVRCIRLCAADAPPPLAIPFPNQFGIAHERF